MKQKLRQNDDIIANLYSNLNKISRNLRQVELPKGFTPERFRTLATIYNYGPISVTGLAEMEALRPATVSRMISSLESDGLIKRRQVKDDKRSVQISTTPKGRQMYLRSNQRYLKHLSQAITELEPEQIRLMGEVAALLEKLSGALKQ